MKRTELRKNCILYETEKGIKYAILKSDESKDWRVINWNGGHLFGPNNFYNCEKFIKEIANEN